ncbi:MAG: hypothetical protein LAP21_13305 [Acidobacteriia bacterium]|nr:hypothetical protein [Terriglobia bacterium]
MPLTAEDRIVLIRVKIERARRHLRDLAADLLTAENVQIAESKHDMKRGEHKTGLSNTEVKTLTRLPVDVITAAGDVVHNLRSALDHLANQLVIVGGGKPDQSTGFPIAKDLATYEVDKPKKVKGMRQVAITAIDNVKPYKGGTAPLWRIHELDIIDKHRHLFAVAHDYLFFGDGFEGDYRLKTDTPDFAGVFDVLTENDVQFEIDRAVGQSQSAKMLPTLREMVDRVEELVLYFKPLLQ